MTPGLRITWNNYELGGKERSPPLGRIGQGNLLVGGGPSCSPTGAQRSRQHKKSALSLILWVCLVTVLLVTVTTVDTSVFSCYELYLRFREDWFAFECVCLCKKLPVTLTKSTEVTFLTTLLTLFHRSFFPTKIDGATQSSTIYVSSHFIVLCLDSKC